MVWTQAVIWKKVNPKLFDRILEADSKRGVSPYGRIYIHKRFESSEANESYMNSLALEIPHASSTYLEVLKEDLRLHKAATIREDCCLQLIDCSEPENI